MNTLKKKLDELTKFKLNSYGKDFLLTWEKSEDELRAVIGLAELFSEMHKAGKSFRAFNAGLALSIFRDNSTRTRGPQQPLAFQSHFDFNSFCHE